MAYGYWIKLYHDILDDHKVGLLPRAARWTFVSCLILAGEEQDGGFLPEMERMLFRLRFDSEAELEGEMSLLARRGLVELRLHPDGSERWYVTHFAERQASMSGAERQKRRRSPQRDAQRNDDVTSVSRNVTDDVTQRDTEVESRSRSRKQKVDREAEAEKNARRAAELAAAAASPSFGVLSEFGIAINNKTRALLDMDPDYTRAHLEAAARAGDKIGLAIRRMLDGDPAPLPPGSRPIPPEWMDVIKH